MSETYKIRKKTIDYKKTIVHLLLILGVAVTITPFLWMILTSLKTMAEATHVPPVIFPKKLIWKNYSDAVSVLPFVKFYSNTIISTAAKTIGQLVFCSMAAYAFARIEFPGRNIIFLVVLSGLMIPGQVYLLPQYMIMQKLGLLNTLTALILPGLFSAFGTFLLRQFFMTIPKELEEAAIIDGASHFKIFTKIMLPLSKPGLTALAIFVIRWAWNDLMWPLIVNSSVEKMTLSAGLASLQGQHLTNYPVLMAGSVLAIWPMIVIFMVFQNAFVEGIALTGTKG